MWGVALLVFDFDSRGINRNQRRWTTAISRLRLLRLGGPLERCCWASNIKVECTTTGTADAVVVDGRRPAVVTGPVAKRLPAAP